MKRKWLNNLKAMGRVPSPSLHVRRDKQQLLNAIALALSETALDPPPLSQRQISRIEEKIFEQAVGGSPLDSSMSSTDHCDTPRPIGTRPRVEGPVPPEVFRGKTTLKITGSFLAQGTLATLSSETISLGDPSAEMVLPEPVSLLVRPRRRSMKLAAIALGATYLLSATVAAASQGTRAGDFLYPVKLQIEAVRITFAGSASDKASIYMAIAADRLGVLRSLQSMEPGNISVTTGEMDGAGLHALRLSQQASSKTKTGLLGDLLALADQEQRVLETLLSRPSQPASQSLSQSYQVARRIELTALRLLLPTGTLPGSATAEVTGTPEMADLEPPRSKGTRKTVGRDRSLAPESGRIPTEDFAPPAAAQPDPDPDQQCAATKGEICIILPIQLPGVPAR